MSKVFVTCDCHCKRCGMKLEGGICEGCGKDRVGPSIAGVIFAVLFGLTVAWLLFGKAY